MRTRLRQEGDQRGSTFKRVAATIRKHLEGVIAIVTTGLSNGRTEALNGKIRTITGRAFGA